MKELQTAIKNILNNPPCEHIVFAVFHKKMHFIRFSNNEVNRENLCDNELSLNIEVGYKNRTVKTSTDKFSEAEIRKSIDEAIESAKNMPEDPEYMPPVTKEEAASVKTNSGEEKTENIAERYNLLNDIFLEVKKAGLNSAGSLMSVTSTNEIYNTKGLALTHNSTESALNVTVMGTKGSYKDFYYSSDLKDFKKDIFIQNLIKMTKLTDKTLSAEAGKYKVVLGPAAIGELMMFFLYYNGDAKNTDEGLNELSLRREKPIAVKDVHLYCDPDNVHLKENAPFDLTNGSPYIPFDIIKDGKFIRGFYSRYYAKKKNVQPSGDGLSYYGGKQNIIFAGGAKTQEELISNVEDGLYINSFWYIRVVNSTGSVFTGMTRDGVFRIKNGKLCESVNNFRFNQNIFDMLKNIVEIGEEKNTEFGRMPCVTIKDFNLVSKTEF